MIIPDSLHKALNSGDQRFIITGAGGWIGRAVLTLLHEALGPDAFALRVLAYASHARREILPGGVVVEMQPLAALTALPTGPCIVLHLAFLTRDKVAVMGHESYVTSNRAITAMLARAMERLRPEAMFVASSGAVYRADRSVEHDLAANPYGALKVEDERQFAALGASFGTRVTIARIFNLAGPFMNKLQSYALGSILSDIAAKRPVTLRARHPVLRSYCDVCDVAALALALLLAPTKPVILFDTAGAEVIEVGALATRALAVLGAKKLGVERQFDPALPADRYVGDGAAQAFLAKQYGLEPYSLDQQIMRTAEYISQ